MFPKLFCSLEKNIYKKMLSFPPRYMHFLGLTYPGINFIEFIPGKLSKGFHQTVIIFICSILSFE